MNTEICVNHHALLADIHAISEQIRALKRLLRATWLKPMATEQRQLCWLKVRATELCSLLAFSRGKLHLRRAPRGAPAEWDAKTYHRRVAERLGPSYALTLEQSA